MYIKFKAINADFLCKKKRVLCAFLSSAVFLGKLLLMIACIHRSIILIILSPLFVPLFLVLELRNEIHVLQTST